VQRFGSGLTGAAGFITGWQCVKRTEAVTMFGSLKSFISNLFEDARLRNQFENKECQLATAALLVRVATVATVDGEMSEAKRGKLHAVLKSRFGLDDLTTGQLINDGVAANRRAIDLYHFTRQLNDVLDDEDRHRIVRMMWEIIYVDGSVNEFEDNIIWRAADLLGVSSRQRIELRQRIAADRATLAPVSPMR
jgi:uncharacterized tellurite resistance protein B-like protein